MNIEMARAFEALALTAGPIKPDVVTKAKALLPLIPLLDDGSEEFAALSDLVRALAFKDSTR